MKYLFPVVVLLIAICISCPRVAYPEQNETESGMYQWTDDNGTVNFTDDPMKIPVKNKREVKKGDSIKGEPSPVQEQNLITERRRPALPTEQLYGGHNENWWRSQFSSVRSEIKNIRNAAPGKETRLKELHYKKTVSNMYGYGGTPSGLGSPRKSKEAYLELYQEIQADKEKLLVLEKKLEKLEEQASRDMVPFEWKEE